VDLNPVLGRVSATLGEDLDLGALLKHSGVYLAIFAIVFPFKANLPLPVKTTAD